MPTGEHLRYLNGISGEVCSDLGAIPAGRKREDDHTHLLAGYPPKACVAALVNALKGRSARTLRQRYRIRTRREHL
jgi:REP element-mobilizing transposase RayT